MTHWREMMDARPTLGAWDFLKKEKDGTSTPIDRTARIKRVDAAKLEGTSTIKKSKKPILTLEDARGKEWDRKLVAGVTICETIGSLYGHDVSKWPGKLITMYGTTTRGASGKTVECVRVRPTVPTTKQAQQTEEPKGPVDEAMRERQLEAAGGPPAQGPGEAREPGSDDV